MSDEEMRIAIAEVCDILSYEDDEKLWRVKGSGFFTSKESACFRLPNYPTDLNAMQEAWALLPTLPMVEREVSNEKIALWYLALVVAPKYAPDWPDRDTYRINAVLAIAGATARQRAVAFLKTLNLYKA